jgi:hypothetical protein
MLGGNMGIKKIVDLFKKDSSKPNGKSKFIHFNSSEMKSHRGQKISDYRNNLANRTSNYLSLSDDQKAEMDKVRETLDKADWDNL